MTLKPGQLVRLSGPYNRKYHARIQDFPDGEYHPFVINKKMIGMFLGTTTALNYAGFQFDVVLIGEQKIRVATGVMIPVKKTSK